MDYEKKYKEALVNARQEYNTTEDVERKQFLEELFPELAESEDERIRKEIIDFILDNETDEDNDTNCWLAWLEKQGKNNSCKFTFEDVLALECSMKTAKTIKGGDELYEILVPLYNKIHDAYLIEKQGEQKETLCDKCKKEQPSHSCQDITALGRCYIDGMNTADKVEPRFKVGDWITNSIETVQITGYDIDYGYQVNYKGNLQHRDTDIIEKEYHLWTLQDANDGDVLVYNNGTVEIILLFKKWMDSVGKGAYSYVHTFDNKILFNDWSDCGYGTHPATKEQCEQLFKAMHEAEYEWDNEKKELKEIEKQSNSVFKASDWYVSKVDGKIHDMTYNPNNKVEHPKWTEEDDANLNCCIAKIKSDIDNGYLGGNKELIEWLKSIKQRMEE